MTIIFKNRNFGNSITLNTVTGSFYVNYRVQKSEEYLIITKLVENELER